MKMNFKPIGLLLLLLLVGTNDALAQQSYRTVFPFLNLPTNARNAALGGNHPSLFEGTGDMMHINPAYMNAESHQNLAISYINHLADVNIGFLTSTYHLDDIGTVGAGVRYVSYGQFDHTNNIGELIGTFTANDIAMNAAISRSYHSLKYGASVDIIHSNYHDYNSTGIALTAGALYEFEDSRTNAAVVIKNLGTQLSYYNGKAERFPLDILASVTHKPEHIPMRLTVTLQKLNDWDLRSFGEDSAPPLGQNLMRHVIFGNEILLGDHVRARIGYNHYQHNQIQSNKRIDTAGLSFGVGIEINRFRFDVSRNSYSELGGLLQMSIQARFNE